MYPYFKGREPPYNNVMPALTKILIQLAVLTRCKSYCDQRHHEY